MHYNAKKINRFIPKLIFILILVAILFVSLSVFDVLNKKGEVEAEIKKLKQENISLNEKKNEFNDLLDYFKDQSFIEKEARRKLNLQKPGEKAVVVIDKREGIGDDVDGDEDQANVFKGSNKAGSGFIGDRVLSNPYKWFNFIFK